MTQLTRHKAGSVRELLTISLPLMVSSLSVLAMVFFDRLFLSYYSGVAMTASVTAGTLSWAFLGSAIILGSMAEVFVAQYNGSRQINRIGEPVWQMVWFSFASILLFVPLAIWGGDLFFRGGQNGELETIYFRYLMVFGFTWPLQGALSAFWVGRGKTRMVTFIAIGANLINISLDWLLIFGIEGLFEPMGIKGAAIATSVGNCAQAALLFYLFTRKAHRATFGTSHIALKFSELRKCLRVGLPQATLFFVELVGFTIFYSMIADRGLEQAFVAGVCQSVLILFFFVAEGIGRGAIAIAGNLIGAKRHPEAIKVFYSGIKVHVTFFLLLAILSLSFPNFFVDIFVGKDFSLFQEGGPLLDASQRELIGNLLRITLHLCVVYLLFEGLRWLVSGLLTAAGDTRFLLGVGIVGVPLFLVLPVYLFIERWEYGVVTAFAIMDFFALAMTCIYLWRFLHGKWQKIDLLG